jgi:hypothetical protein
MTVSSVLSGTVWSTAAPVLGSARRLAPWPPVPNTSTRSPSDAGASVGLVAGVDVADALDDVLVGGAPVAVEVAGDVAVLLGVTVGVGCGRNAVETIQPVVSPSWTLRQIRPSASRSVPTTITSAPSRTDLTTAEPVPGSTRMLTAGLPLPITTSRSGAGVGRVVAVGDSVGEAATVGASVAVARVGVAGGTGDGEGGGAVGTVVATGEAV